MKKFFTNKKCHVEGVTPTVLYFIEKTKNNPDLDKYKESALNYMELRNPQTPPDFYFAQLWSMQKFSRGFIPPHMQQKLLDTYEQQAIQYVQQLNAPKPALTT